MKKFISMVMAAAMVVTMIPATAFAAKGEAWATTDGTTKVTGALTKEEGFTYGNVPGHVDQDNAPEVRIELGKVLPQETDSSFEQDITITLDGATFTDRNGNPRTAEKLLEYFALNGDAGEALASYSGLVKTWTISGETITATASDFDTDDLNTITFTIATTSKALMDALADSVFTFDLCSTLDSADAGHVAYVTVDTTIENVNIVDVPYCTVADRGITASVKKVGVVAEEEWENLKSDLVIKSVVGNFDAAQDFEVKVSKGFEIKEFAGVAVNDDETTFTATDRGVTLDGNKITIDKDDIEIEATTAKAGDVATLTIKAVADKPAGNTFSAKATVEVMTVCEYKVVMSVDEDEDVPVFYSGVDTDNTGLTDDADHWALEVTLEETFPGAWSMRKGFDLTLPEGVFVTDAKVIKAENFYVEGPLTAAQCKDAWEDALWTAYRNGDHANFEFAKRTFDDVNTQLADKPAKVVLQLQVVAEPGFEGDVVLGFKGDLVDAQEVTIAKFVVPYTVKAEQNDVKIDYRYTAVETPIVITEAAAGLWNDDHTDGQEDFAGFYFTVDRGDMIQFEDGADFAVTEDSEMEIDSDIVEGRVWRDAVSMSVWVEEVSDEEAAEITISDISLFMQRNIPAGAYDLTMTTTMSAAFDAEVLFAADSEASTVYIAKDDYSVAAYDADEELTGDNYVVNVADYEDTVKAAWVNVVTAGREVDDASFTTKVLVPIGETTIYAGDKAYTIPVPAYINADGYTMMPIRAVAVALGIDNDAVQWDDATKTVIVMYGQRFITMTAGQKVIYVSGTALPAKSAVEIVDGRAFLGLRDLATALGVTKIDYVDGVASLN